MECHICCEKFNKSNHKQVDCGFCDLSCCRSCVQSYLLSSIQDAHCMKCKKEWDREFVDTSCTKIFRNGKYKTHRETILFERERCLLPATQHLVAQEKAKRETKRKADIVRDEIDLKKIELRALEHRLWSGNFGVSAERKTFVRKCPHEGCKGFLSSVWKCDVCDNWTCPHCNEVKGEQKDVEHTCDQNNVETVNLLKKDTKPCPSCGTMIFKISGCSQMWCPDCHTAFDWRSGNIETGMVHNPHFYEFQRRTGNTGRVAGDIPCGGLPSIQELRAYFTMPARTTAEWRRREVVPNNMVYIWELHRFITHTERYELVYQYNPRPVDNTILRVQYLMNELPETAFKTLIQKREKAYTKLRAMRDIFQMFVNTASDIMRQMLVNNESIVDTDTILRQLVEYCNDTFYTLAKRYSTSAKQILFTTNGVSSSIQFA